MTTTVSLDAAELVAAPLSRDYGRIVSASHFERLVEYLDDGAVTFGGAHAVPTRYLEPTALREVPDDVPVMTDEIFGPVLPIRTVPSTDDAIAFVNDRDKPQAVRLRVVRP